MSELVRVALLYLYAKGKEFFFDIKNLNNLFFFCVVSLSSLYKGKTYQCTYRANLQLNIEINSFNLFFLNLILFKVSSIPCFQSKAHYHDYCYAFFFAFVAPER